MQENVKIGEIVVPVIKEGGERWYPISYIMNKVLLRSMTAGVVIRQNKNIGSHVKKLHVDYSFLNQATQNTHCINDEGMKILLLSSKVGRLDVEQKKALNVMLDYYNIENICEDERYIDKLNRVEISKYNIYIQDCIEEVLKENKEIKWQLCTKCNKYYPYYINFFSQNLNSSAELNTICRSCYSWDHNRTRTYILHPNGEFTKIYRKYGESTYLHYKQHDTLKIYEHYLTTKSKHIPKIIHNKVDYLIIIKHLHQSGKISVRDLNIKELGKASRLTTTEQIIKNHELYQHLFGDEPINFPWLYPNYKLPILQDEDMRNIFNNYLNKNNIKIKDIFKFNYTDILYKAAIIHRIEGDTLSFVMFYYNYEYPAYKFQGGYINHWKIKQNRINAMKYLVESDLKIPIEKIPLYLTKYNLKKHSGTMYNILIHKKYYGGNLYKWINECYPNKFVEADFNINVIRNEFDSMEEAQIHDFLVDRFGGNVIYNKREGSYGISINKMMPDWCLFTEKGCCLIEYFGLYVENSSSKRIMDYVKRTHVKINKYKKLKDYKFIFLYPDDLKNDLERVKIKLEKVVS